MDERSAQPPAIDQAGPAQPPAIDQDVRDRVTRDLATTFLLEAGAGTGKTKVLVDRYVRCVLDPQRGAGDVAQVAAITFTEKAAGELRQRIREELERLARSAEGESGSMAGADVATAPGDEDLQRWAQAGPPADRDVAAVIFRALDALDDAPIGTIHGFAARLLREVPVEAGIDPGFEQLDALAAEIERGRLWDEWLTGLAADDAADRPEREWLIRLLRAGVRLDHIRELAVGSRGAFNERYDVRPVAPPAEPDLLAALQRLRVPTDQLRQLCVEACTDQSDRGFAAAMGLVEAVQSLLRDPPSDTDRLAAALHQLPVKGADATPGGRASCWDAACGGKDELHARFKAVAGTVVALRDLHAEHVVSVALAVVDAFVRWAAEAQIGLGHLDFTDLLGRLRDLLATNRHARRTLQQRFRYLLVDEFQDTDPLQAEIVAFLCERSPLADDWRDVVLEPGKLFVVGDPKQSIYRFRRADIGLYDQVKDLINKQPAGTASIETICQNFRTTPAIVNWVNEVFAGVFNEDAAKGRQPRYEPVYAYRPAVAGSAVSVVHARGQETGESDKSSAIRSAEARAIAGLLLQMHDSDDGLWLVHDPGRPATGAQGRSRPPRWGDIALLFRGTTDLETYEEALRDAAIPYRVDGGTTYFQRREVADVLLCLRAVDDPTDGAAVYGALHSALFGFSDDDLFLFWAAGGSFDVFRDQQPIGHEDVAAALKVLRTLHEQRTRLEPHELTMEVLRLTHAVEVAATTGSAAPQAIANLEKLVDRARAFAGSGGGGLAAFLAWAAKAGDAAGEQESPVDDAGDAVRLLTIHKAKGLEFPVVVLVGGALASPGRRGPVRPIVDRIGRQLSTKLKVDLPGMPDVDLQPPTFLALKKSEDEMERSELRRLLYVAATRARDHLVLSLFGKLANKDGSAPAGSLLAPLRQYLPLPGAEEPPVHRASHGLRVLVAPEPVVVDVAGRAHDVAALVHERGAWQAERTALLCHAGRPAAVTTPSGLEHIDPEARSEGVSAAPGREAALLLGTLVHGVMEHCDLADEASVARTALALAAGAGRPDLAERVGALAAACWRAPCVRAAAASPQMHRELPIGVLIDDVVVSGSVDLLYLDGEEWVIVDYKTDRDAEDALLRARYGPQGAAYAVAVEHATQRRVGRIVLVAAAADGREVWLPVDDELRVSVVGEVRRAVAESRAIRADELGAVGVR